MPRLTKDRISTILNQNEGFKARTSYSSRNSSYERQYTVTEGKVKIRSTGKTSWADSNYDDTYYADSKQTRRFIKKFLDY